MCGGFHSVFFLEMCPSCCIKKEIRFLISFHTFFWFDGKWCIFSWKWLWLNISESTFSIFFLPQKIYKKNYSCFHIRQKKESCLVLPSVWKGKGKNNIFNHDSLPHSLTQSLRSPRTAALTGQVGWLSGANIHLLFRP